MIYATGSPVQIHSYFHLLLVAGISVLVTISCDEHVEEVGDDEIEYLVDEPRTTNGT